MKTVCKKLLCLMLVAMLLVSAVPAAFAAEGDYTFWYELWVDGAAVSAGEKNVQVAPNTEFTEAEIKAQAQSFWPEYFSNYEFDKITESTKADANNNGVRVWLKTAEECQHTGTRTTAEMAATCTASGVKKVTCDDCGEVLVNETIAALGHNYVDGVCTRCGAEDPNAQGNVVKITIYETDVDGNAVQYKTVEVDVDAYASKDALVKAVYGKQFSDYRYRDFGDGTAQLVVYGVETKEDAAVYQLKVIHNNGTSNYTLIDIYDGEGILAAISNAGVVKKLKNTGYVVDDVEYVLVGFSAMHTGNSKTSLNIYHTASEELADAYGYITVYADWEKKTDDSTVEYEFTDSVGGLGGDANEDPIYDVVLYIYTNGKTSSYAKKVTSSTMGRFTKDGILTDDEVQLVVENYFKTTSDTKYYGLFDKETWNSGNYLTRNAEYEVKLSADKTNYVYVMVKDATAYVADSSNPKTGDTIMIAVSTMALAAAGLVSMIELKKRKMI